MTSRRRGNTLAVRLLAGVAALALVAGLVLTFLPKSSSTTSTTGTTSTTAGPTTTMADADYQQTVDQVRALVTAAGTDRCQLAIAFTQVGTLPPPANPTQTKWVVEVTSALLTQAATAAGSGAAADAAIAKALGDAGTALTTEAAAAGYDPAYFTKSPGAPALSTEAFLAAIKTYRQKDVELCNTVPSTTTGPPAGPTTTAGP